MINIKGSVVLGLKGPSGHGVSILEQESLLYNLASTVMQKEKQN